MNKRELAKAVAVQADVELKTVTAVLDGFTDVVTAVVAKGEPISIPGFAKFVKVNRAARMGRNPATGETIRIKASKKARITPVKAFKDAVLNPPHPSWQRAPSRPSMPLLRLPASHRRRSPPRLPPKRRRRPVRPQLPAPRPRRRLPAVPR
jgi:DNA-binding protein HU-beta